MTTSLAIVTKVSFAPITALVNAANAFAMLAGLGHPAIVDPPMIPALRREPRMVSFARAM